MKSRLAGLLGRFMTPAQSADPLRLGEFIRAQGAYVAQKTVLDYCRVKSGRHEEKLFSEPMFRAALDHCRWQVFFGALADVTAMSESWLRPHVPERAERLREALARLYDSALMADPPPEQEHRSIDGFSIRSHLAGLQISPPTRSNKMPLLAEAPLFATLPIHPEQRVGEAGSIRGALRFLLVSAHLQMERRFDARRLAARLVAED